MACVAVPHPYKTLRAIRPDPSFRFGQQSRTASVVVALPCSTWPIVLPSIQRKRLHHQTPGPNIHLVHIPVLMVWRNAVQVLTGLGGDYRMGLPELAILLTITLIAAASIHTAVERPGRRLIRRLLDRSQPEPAAERRRSVHSDQGEPF